jgi:hypothetical protein
MITMATAVTVTSKIRSTQPPTAMPTMTPTERGVSDVESSVLESIATVVWSTVNLGSTFVEATVLRAPSVGSVVVAGLGAVE